MNLQPYSAKLKPAWDAFAKRSRNGLFQFQRDYMEYHSDRFTDFSLVALDDQGGILALLPASIEDNVVHSHAGLTFGGVVTNERMKISEMMDFFDALGAFLRAKGVEKLIYKSIPHIYHRIPAEEDRYALFRNGAARVRCDISSTVRTDARLPLSKGRRYAIKQAHKAGLAVEMSHDFEAFMRLEEALLAEKYATRPTHSGKELALLASRFPERIKLFTVHIRDELIAGVVVYLYDTVAHAQYIAASDTGKQLGALDLIIDHLIGEVYSNVPFFDFGISTEHQGTYLNEGLVANKQSFGARAVVHETYEWRVGG